MALNYDECEDYIQGEIRPLIFEVYTESGIPFELCDDSSLQGDQRAYCELKDEKGKLIHTLMATIISDEPAKKTFVVSWDTSKYLGYYRLQVWCVGNISGSTDAEGRLIVEFRLCSEELVRYVHL